MKKKISIGIMLFLLTSVQSIMADETVTGFKIKTAKESLSLIMPDSFGNISLKRLKNDIDNNVIYQFKRHYGDCVLEVESQNSPKHYGSLSFSYHGAKSPINVNYDDLKKHFSNMNVKHLVHDETDTWHWKSNGFACSVDFNKKLKLFEYLCLYIN